MKIEFTRIGDGQKIISVEEGGVVGTNYTIMTNIDNEDKLITYACNLLKLIGITGNFSMRMNDENECYDISVTMPTSDEIEAKMSLFEKAIFEEAELEMADNLRPNEQEALFNMAVDDGAKALLDEAIAGERNEQPETETNTA